jgi:hypothetical protein
MSPIEQHSESISVMDGDDLSVQEACLSERARRGEDKGPVKGNGNGNTRLILSFGSDITRGSKATGKDEIEQRSNEQDDAAISHRPPRVYAK